MTDTEKDAARYRWLRDEWGHTENIPRLAHYAILWRATTRPGTCATIDEAIDLEIARSEAAKGGEGK